MNRALPWAIALAVVLALLAGGYHLVTHREPPPLPPAAEAPPAPAGPSGPRNPIATAPADAQLPPLDQSDAGMRDALVSLLGAEAVERFLNTEGVVRRIVATVDNLAREQYAQRLDPVRPMPGTLRTTGKDATLALAAENSARYVPFIDLATRVDTARLVQLYQRHYPQFQAAYVELGYPNGYFNDRLVEVIDELLAAPAAPATIALATPHVLPEFADPDLEELASGQKVLLRMGPDNAARVKAKLRELRAAIAAPAR
jgi:hypothetical protein